MQQVSAVPAIGYDFNVPEIEGSHKAYLYTYSSTVSVASSSLPGGMIAGIVVTALVVIVGLAVGLGTVIFLMYR